VKNYLLINQQTNIVDNLCIWNGDTQTWTPPPNYLCLPQDTTPRITWVYDEQTQSWVSCDATGTGSIGDTWDGQTLIAPELYR